MAFANLGDDFAFDAIPLAEVTSVEQINEKSLSSVSGLPPVESQKSADAARTLFQNAIQVKTDADGYNSGRTYYLQATSAEQCNSVCASVAVLARRARKAVVAGTLIRRLQGKVLRFYESMAFQSFVAVLIISVRSLLLTVGPHHTSARAYANTGLYVNEQDTGSNCASYECNNSNAPAKFAHTLAYSSSPAFPPTSPQPKPPAEAAELRGDHREHAADVGGGGRRHRGREEPGVHGAGEVAGLLGRKRGLQPLAAFGRLWCDALVAIGGCMTKRKRGRKRTRASKSA